MQVLERAHEQERLVALLDRARAGRGAAVVIEGPAGIGKTSLLEQVRVDAGERGFRRLVGVGDEAEQALPWGRRRLSVPPGQGSTRSLSPRARTG